MRSSFTEGVASAVADIRQKWEEFVYGKAVTPRRQNITISTLNRAAGKQSPAERLGWSKPGEQPGRSAEPGWFARNFTRDSTRDGDRTERAHPSREQERGIER